MQERKRALLAKTIWCDTLPPAFALTFNLSDRSARSAHRLLEPDLSRTPRCSVCSMSMTLCLHPSSSKCKAVAAKFRAKNPWAAARGSRTDSPVFTAWIPLY